MSSADDTASDISSLRLSKNLRWAIRVPADGRACSSGQLHLYKASSCLETDSSELHMVEVRSLKPGAPRQPGFVATAPTTSSCGHSSYQQGLSEPTRPEASSSLCCWRPVFVHPTSPTVSELDCAIGALGEATRAHESSSLLSSWTLRPSGLDFTAQITDAAGCPREADGLASSGGVENGNWPPRSLDGNVEAPEMGVGVDPEVLPALPVRLDCSYPAEGAVAGRNHRARWTPHPISAIPRTHTLGHAEEMASAEKLGVSHQRSNLAERGQHHAVPSIAHCDARQRPICAAAGAAAAPGADPGRKRSWSEESGAGHGLECNASPQGLRPPRGSKPRRVDLDHLDAPGLQHLAAAADAILQTPQLRFRAAGGVPTSLHDRGGLAPSLASRDIGDVGTSGGRSMAPHSAYRYDPAPDMQRSYGWCLDGASCRGRREAGQPTVGPLGAQHTRSCSPWQPQQLGAQLEQEQEDRHTLELNAEALYECRADVARVQGSRLSFNGALAPPMAPSRGPRVRRMPLSCLASSAPASTSSEPPEVAPSQIGPMVASATVRAEPDASAPQPPDAARRPAGREALHEALIMLTTKYYMDRGLPINE